ncbi:MAG: hypothetical protein ACKO6B_08335, partial [Planctomycetia bacterium]
VIGRAGKNAGGVPQPAPSAAGRKTPSVTRVPQVHVVVERRAEAVQEGDAAEPRAGSTRCVGSSGDTGGRDQSPLDLVKTVTAADQQGDRDTLKADSFIPAAMAAIYLAFLLYFASIGGYRRVQMSSP